MQKHPRLNLPPQPFSIREIEGKTTIFDPVRKKYVRLTPEEWVRLHFSLYLQTELHYPRSWVYHEYTITKYNVQKRFDIIVLDKHSEPLLLVECKAYHKLINQQTFDQIAQYASVYMPPYLIVTNGYDHYCCEKKGGRYVFIDSLPRHIREK